MTLSNAINGSLPLAHWGLIRARGNDAVSFLQGQLTNDVSTLDLLHARLAGFCSAKGRLQASFVMWKLAEDDVLLACASSLLASTLKRLSMFVLRAKCKLSDASTELALIGIVGDSARVAMGDTPVWGRRYIDGGSLVRLPDVDGLPRCMAAVSVDADLASTRAGSPGLTLAQWQRLEVHSGVPLIEAATVDQFVPQMLNFELIGGVDFKKGCYPGQEIVARSQYRGTLKRRMFLFKSDAPMQAGQEVFHNADASQPAGMVVNAAVDEDDQRQVSSAALIEIKLATLDTGELHLGAADGPLLRLGTLPYQVPRDGLNRQ